MTRSTNDFSDSLLLVAHYLYRSYLSWSRRKRIDSIEPSGSWKYHLFINVSELSAAALIVRCMSAACPLHVRWMSVGCPLDVRWMSAGCPLDVRWISAACPLHVRCMSAACPLHVRFMSASCPLLVRCMKCWSFSWGEATFWTVRCEP